MQAERRQARLWEAVHPRGGQRGQRRPVWGRDQPYVASLGPGQTCESCRGRQGSTRRRCPHRTVTIRQELEGAGKGRYRAGHRVLTLLCRHVGSVVNRFRQGFHRLKISGAMKHIHKIAAGQGWGAVAAYQGNWDEVMVACERDASIACVKEVLTTCWGRTFTGESHGSA